jgi:hypothetical protein
VLAEKHANATLTACRRDEHWLMITQALVANGAMVYITRRRDDAP